MGTVTASTTRLLHAIRSRDWLLNLIVIGGYALTLAVLGLTRIIRDQQLSPFDEAAHVDYAWKAAHGRVAFPGSTLDPEMLQAWSCRGQNNVVLPPCGSDAGPEQYPARGENYHVHPPLFYAVSGIFARILGVVGVDFVDGARVAGLLWILAGMVLLYFALREWRVPVLISAAIPLLVPTIHMMLLSGTTVNNDASAVAAGAAAVYVLGRILVRGKHGVILPIVATALVAMTKLISVIPLLAVGLVLVIGAYVNRRDGAFPRPGRAWTTLGGMIAATGIVYVGWSFVRSRLKVEGWTNPLSGVNTRDITGLPFDEWIRTTFSGMVSISYGPTWLERNYELDVAWTGLVQTLLVAVPFVVLVLFSIRRREWFLGAAAVAAMIMLPAVVQLQTYVGSGGETYFPGISVRYALANVPVLLACAAVVLHEKRWKHAAWVTAAVGLVVALITLVVNW